MRVGESGVDEMGVNPTCTRFQLKIMKHVNLCAKMYTNCMVIQSSRMFLCRILLESSICCACYFCFVAREKFKTKDTVGGVYSMCHCQTRPLYENMRIFRKSFHHFLENIGIFQKW